LLLIKAHKSNKKEYSFQENENADLINLKRQVWKFAALKFFYLTVYCDFRKEGLRQVSSTREPMSALSKGYCT